MQGLTQTTTNFSDKMKRAAFDDPFSPETGKKTLKQVIFAFAQDKALNAQVSDNAAELYKPSRGLDDGETVSACPSSSILERWQAYECTQYPLAKCEGQLDIGSAFEGGRKHSMQILPTGCEVSEGADTSRLMMKFTPFSSAMSSRTGEGVMSIGRSSSSPEGSSRRSSALP